MRSDQPSTICSNQQLAISNWQSAVGDGRLATNNLRLADCDWQVVAG